LSGAAKRIPAQQLLPHTFIPTEEAVPVMDLAFLRTLAASKLPRTVPPGPAFQLVLAYQAAGLLDVTIPPTVRTRSGGAIQLDALVTAITEHGWAALQTKGTQPS
jgi:hypothetical protein